MSAPESADFNGLEETQFLLGTRIATRIERLSPRERLRLLPALLGALTFNLHDEALSPDAIRDGVDQARYYLDGLGRYADRQERRRSQPEHIDLNY